MSANLWDESTASRKPDAEGVYVIGPHEVVTCSATGASVLAENQAVHMGASLRGADAGYAMPFVEYRDAAGNLHWVGFPHWTPTDEWQRFEGSCVVPSGMTVTRVGFNGSAVTGGVEVSNPVFSYGSAVTLASALRTRSAPSDRGYAPLRRQGGSHPQRVELTFTDPEWRDLGTVTPLDGDFAYGSSENSFAVDFDGEAVPPVGGLLYAEGSDVGGMVTGYDNRPDQGTFQVTGLTWTGLMGTRVVRPDAGAAYLTLSGDVREIAAQLVGRLGLGFVFHVSGGSTGVVVTHRFDGSRDPTQKDAGRYMDGWAAMWQLVREHGCSLRMRWDGSLGKVRLTVLRRSDWTGDEAADAGLATVGVSSSRPVNHLVCLGKGELADRMVVDLYADARGSVSRTQSLAGRDESAAVYEDTSAEDEAALVTRGTRKLLALRAEAQEVTITSGASDTSFDLGDVIGGRDSVTGASATAVVTKKVARFSGGAMQWQYKTT